MENIFCVSKAVVLKHEWSLGERETAAWEHEIGGANTSTAISSSLN